MAVIINDFEIVAEAAGKASREGVQENAGKSKEVPLSPDDIEAVLVHTHERWLRVRAD